MYLHLLKRGKPEKRARYMTVLKEQTNLSDSIAVSAPVVQKKPPTCRPAKRRKLERLPLVGFWSTIRVFPTSSEFG